LLRGFGILLGWIWSFPLHGLFGLLLLCTVYFPKKIRFRRGYVQVVVRRHLIPEGIDRTGDGDIDDPEDFRTGGQAHGGFMFHASERQWDREDHVHHEETHVWQCFVLGGVLYPLTYGLSYAINRLRGMNAAKAYRSVWHEKQAYGRQAKFLAERRAK
jgi:hypothetical protein